MIARTPAWRSSDLEAAGARERPNFFEVSMAALYSRITVVRPDGSDTLYKKRRKKRRISPWLRPIERAARRSMRAKSTFQSELLRRHNRSNRKRRNGWLRDIGINMLRAQGKAMKKLR
jgi:hypothetical protein